MSINAVQHVSGNGNTTSGSNIVVSVGDDTQGLA